MLRQFDALKEKHPDALLLFRTGDFYEAYGKDAVKAAAILAVEITDRILPDRKLQVASFPVSELDTNLPKLIRSGARVALCDQISDDVRKKADKTNHFKRYRHGKEEKDTAGAGRACPDSEEHRRGETCPGKEYGTKSRH